MTDLERKAAIVAEANVTLRAEVERLRARLSEQAQLIGAASAEIEKSEAEVERLRRKLNKAEMLVRVEKKRADRKQAEVERLRADPPHFDEPRDGCACRWCSLSRELKVSLLAQYEAEDALRKGGEVVQAYKAERDAALALLEDYQGAAFQGEAIEAATSVENTRLRAERDSWRRTAEVLETRKREARAERDEALGELATAIADWEEARAGNERLRADVATAFKQAVAEGALGDRARTRRDAALALLRIYHSNRSMNAEQVEILRVETAALLGEEVSDAVRK